MTRGSKMRSCWAAGMPLSVVEDGEQAFVAGLLSGEEDAAGAGIAGVAQHLDDNVPLERMSWAAWRRSASEDRRDEAVSRGHPRPGDGSRRTSSMKSLRVSPSMAYLA